MTEATNYASVAIVDDEKELVRTYELLFKRRNIPVCFFSGTGEEAVELFRKAGSRPKVVIVDYRLPAMDGIAVMKEILSIDPGTQIIMISGDTTVKQQCLDAGASAFLKKPTGITEISETVCRLLNDRQADSTN